MRQIIINKQIVSEELVSLLKEKGITFKEIDIDTAPCPLCGKEFIMRGVGTVNERKFCSVSCRSKFNSRVEYKFKKDNPEYKQKKKEYFEKWRKENKSHFNDLLREPNRIKSRENYKKWDKLGSCVQCGKRRDNPNSKICLRCRNFDKRIQSKSNKNAKKITKNNN